MIDRQKVIDVVYKAIDELNQTLPAESRVAKSLETLLSGPSGVLDSMGLVNLVVETEEQIEEAFGVTINLGDSQAAAADQNPLATLESLVVYIVAQLEREAD